METIRNARIIVHLEQGKVELKAPDLKPLLADQERQIQQTQQLEQETRKLAQAQRSVPDFNNLATGVQDEINRRFQQAAREGGPSEGGPIGPTAENLARMKEAMELQRQRVEVEEEVSQAVSRTSDVQDSASQRLLGHQRQMLIGMQQVGEGVFRMGRAMVLLGASNDDSFGKMIQSLARVQAYFDLFKGTSLIIRGVTTAIEAMQKAQTAAAVAAGTMTAAEAAATAGTLTLSGAIGVLMVVLTPLTIALGVLAAALLALDYAWHSSAEAAKEAAAQAEENRQIASKASADYINWLDQRITREQELKDILFERMTAEQQAAATGSIVERGMQSGDRTSTIVDEGLFEGEGRAAAIEMERQAALDAIKAIERQEQAERKRIDAAQDAIDLKVREIEKQERLVDAAKRQYEIEQKKLIAFQAQVGALSDFEQRQLIAIRDKLRAGQDISRFEEDFLAENAGEAGKGIADARRAKRGEAAGFGADFFQGIEGASTGLKDAAKSLDDVVAALNKLTDGASAAEAKAKLEQEKQALEQQYKDFYAENTKSIEKLAAILKIINEKLAAVENALLQGGH